MPPALISALFRGITWLTYPKMLNPLSLKCRPLSAYYVWADAKVEAAIRDCFASQQWHRLRMLMDPLHPADKADLLERISIDEIQILVSQYGVNLIRKFCPIWMRKSVKMLLKCLIRRYLLPRCRNSIQMML